MKCKISVIIPVYNTEAYIGRCLNSVIQQTFKDYEIIVVDDGSTDKSRNIINDIIAENKDVVINYIYQENAGQAAARNAGIDRAEGEYISFLDSDDYIDKFMFEELYKEAKISNADIIVSDLKCVYDDSEYMYVFKNFREWSNNNIINYIVSNAGPCGKLVRTSIIKDNALYFPTGIFYEDLAVVPSYALYASKIIYVPKTYYNYLQRANSTMNQTKYNPRLENIFDALVNLRNEFIKAGKADTYKEELEYIYIYHLLYGGCTRFMPYEDVRAKNNIIKIIDKIKKEFPDFKNNIYFKKREFKFRLLCNLLYSKKLSLAKKLADNMMKKKRVAWKK